MKATNNSIIEKIIKLSNIPSSSILNIYPYGSRVYGTNSEKSDYDFILIINSNKSEVHLEDFSLNIYPVDLFKQMLQDHEISAIECISLKHPLRNDYPFEFKLNKPALRKSISEKASHSFVKAKKKFIVEKDKDIYAGKKSLFHSLRIIDFGMQIAKEGKVTNWSSCNDLWSEIIKNDSEEWDVYRAKYKPIHNSMMSEFRKLAPKEN